jgi:hypothetical protein
VILIRALGFALLALVFAGVDTAGAQELGWRKYTNERHGFVLSYPATLVASAEAQNGSGREFHTPDKAFSLAVSAQFFHPDIGDTYEARWKEELSSLGDTVTYKKKTDAWYVVSGVANDGTEYYHKTMRKGGNWVAFHITYPPRAEREVRQVGRTNREALCAIPRRRLRPRRLMLTT